MEKIRIGNLSDFHEMTPRYARVNGAKVFVYLHEGKLYAYADMCPHQGGPACEGDLRSAVMGKVNEAGLYLESDSNDSFSIVCPWHGVEYDLENGQCRTNRKQRLRRFNISVEGNEVYLE